jgi:hypothetical protein
MLKQAGGPAGETGEVPGAWLMAVAVANPWQAGNDGRREVIEEDAGELGTPSWWSERRVAHHGQRPMVAHVCRKRTPVRWG